MLKSVPRRAQAELFLPKRARSQNFGLTITEIYEAWWLFRIEEAPYWPTKCKKVEKGACCRT